MSNDELILVGSRLTMDIDLRLSTYVGDKVVITGITHPTTDGMAITENVPAGLFRQWMREHATSDMVAGGYVFEVPAGTDVSVKPKEFGHEAALEKAATDPEQSKIATAPRDDETPSAAIHGAHIPVPDPLPTPPAEEERSVAKEGEPVPATDPDHFQPGGNIDDPKQDQNLKA